MAKIKTDGIIFDVDGTLWDASENLAKAWTRTVQSFGVEEEISVKDIGDILGMRAREIADHFRSRLGEQADEIMKAALEQGGPVTLPSVNTIADGVAVKTVGDKVFPYVQKNLDGIITISDDELVETFLDMMEKHKMVVENSGLLTVAALRHLDCRGKFVVPILSGGNMDVITMSSLIQHGLIHRGRVFTFSVMLPDQPGELLNIARIVAEQQGNIIKLEHNQFVSINRQAEVELRVTLEAFGNDHKNAIVQAMEDQGYTVRIVPATATFG